MIISYFPDARRSKSKGLDLPDFCAISLVILAGFCGELGEDV